MTERRGLLLTILLSIVFLAALELRDPYFFQTDDNSDHFLPWYTLNYRTLRDTGAPALVNWHQYMGQAHFSHGLTGVLYLPNYVCSWLATEVRHDSLETIDWLAIAHLVAGTALLFSLLRAYECRVEIAVAGALCALTLPFVVSVSRIWVSISINYFFLALALLCLRRFKGDGWRRALGVYAIARALFVMHGNVQYVAFTGIFELVFIFASLIVDRRALGRVLLCWCAGNVAGLILSLPMLWEMAQASSISWRNVAVNPEMASSWSMPISTLLAAQIGFFPEFVMEFSTQIAFVGVALIGVLFSWRAWKSSAWRDGTPWLITAGFAAFLAVGWGSIFDLPGLDRFRWPFKFLLYLGWFGTVGVTICLSRLDGMRALNRMVAPGALLVALGLQVWVNFRPSTFRAFAQRRVTKRVELLADAIPQDGRVAAVQPVDINVCNLFTFNYATFTGHLCVSGYDPLISKFQWRALLGTGYAGFVPGPFNNLLMAWMIENGVRYIYILASPETEKRLQSAPGISEFLRTDKWVVYRLAQTVPLSYIAHPDGTIEGLRTQFHGNLMKVDVTGASGLAVLNVYPMPNLQARFDGGEWRDLGLAMGKPFVKIQPGARTLEVSLSVPSLRWTVPLSLFMLVICLKLCLPATTMRPSSALGSA